jgi:arabinofuranosyltransferase
MGLFRGGRLLPREDAAPPPIPWRALLLLLDSAIFGVFLYQWCCFSCTFIDDAYITLRYARNLAMGHGLVYNPGEMVEGISNPGWAILIALAHRLGMDPTVATARLTLLFGAAAFVLLRQTALKALGTWSIFARLPLLLFALSSLIPMGTQGLESPLWIFSLLLAAYGAITRSIPATATAFFMMVLARADGPLYAVLFTGWRLLQVRSCDELLRGFLPVAAACVVAVGGITAWRYGYYGDIVPNTVRAKMLPLELALPRGQRYLTDYLLQHVGIILPLLALAGCVLSRQRMFCVLMVGLVAANMAVALRNGGDWMQHFRLLTPFLPLLWLAAAIGAATLGRLGRLPALLAVLLMLYPARGGLDSKALAEHTRFRRWPVLELAMGQPADSTVTFMNEPHRASLSELGSEDDLVLLELGGKDAYVAPNVRALEFFGLTDRQLATSRPDTAVLMPTLGVVDWEGIWERRPDFLNLSSIMQTGMGVKEAAQLRRLEDFAFVRRQPSMDLRSDNIPCLLVRLDHPALARFVLDYPAAFPARDFVDGAALRTTSRFMEESFVDANGTRLPQRWQDWGGYAKLATRLPVSPTPFSFRRPIPADTGMIIVAGVPSQDNPGALIHLESPGGTATLDTRAGEAASGMQRFAVYLPPGAVEGLLEVHVSAGRDGHVDLACHPVTPKAPVDLPAISSLPPVAPGDQSGYVNSLLMDGGFEQATPGGAGSPWSMTLSGAEGILDHDVGIEGQRALCIRMPGNAMATLEQPLREVPPQTGWRVGGQYRMENLRAPLGMELRDATGALVASLGEVRGSTGWTAFSAFVPPQPFTGPLTLVVRAGNYEGSAAALWLDDLHVQPETRDFR